MMTAEKVERVLREGLAPVHVEVEDESWRHAGHAGAREGGGHFRIVAVSERFRGLSLVERQRKVYGLFEGVMGDGIHALSMKTFDPEEWEKRAE